MALALQKKKREDRRNTTDGPGFRTNPPAHDAVVVKRESPSVPPPDPGETERGRRFDKGKAAKISVVGFEADGADDPEFVYACKVLAFARTDPLFRQGHRTNGLARTQ